MVKNIKKTRSLPTKKATTMEELIGIKATEKAMESNGIKATEENESFFTKISRKSKKL